MQNRYRVFYVGDDSRSHSEVVWAADHKAAIAKVRAKGVEIVTGARRLMSPLAILVIVLGIIAFVVLALVQK